MRALLAMLCAVIVLCMVVFAVRVTDGVARVVAAAPLSTGGPR